MVYLDTSILLIFTLTRSSALERYAHVAALFDLIDAGVVKAITSFYALHELLVFAIRNAPDIFSGADVAKSALIALFQTKLVVFPLLTREEKILNLRMFSALADSSDVSHAITAYRAGCTAIVAYDEHYKDLPPFLAYLKPEEFIAQTPQKQNELKTPPSNL